MMLVNVISKVDQAKVLLRGLAEQNQVLRQV